MKQLRPHVAISIDGGGYRGVMAAKALTMLEEHTGKTCSELCQMAAGTSTGSIIGASIAKGIRAREILSLYERLGGEIFRGSLRKTFWFVSRYRYSNEPLARALRETLADTRMGELWDRHRCFDLVITIRDVVENRTLFVKPWKDTYRHWPLWKAALASSAVPTYFPVVDGRYVDGGFGSYANPCYVAAYEAVYCLGWDPRETTLISLGTGRDNGGLAPGQAGKLRALGWIDLVVDTFMDDANDQQVHLVSNLFPEIDFRRIQVSTKDLAFDDPGELPRLLAYGEELGENLLNDVYDTVPMEPAKVIPER